VCRRRRGRWKDNIKNDLTGIGCEDVGWIHVAHCRDYLWVLEFVVSLKMGVEQLSN
jgi:hypothetical protein